MSRLTDLLRQARATDPQLSKDLEAEFAALMKRRTFGLVFEKHQPEAVDLAGRPIRVGDKVRVLPPRGELTKGDQRLWKVKRIERVDGARVAHLEEIDTDTPQHHVVLLEDLVVVAEFRDRIFPGLVETGRVERSGDKPFHTVINAENYHALEMLTYTHRHSIDAIYIDPPYNTGAKDWKYNNDYVASDDDYRHSKWLAFMERRLEIAKELLNPDDSVLIVTIDEKEYLRLGLLLEQTFPEGHIQMVTCVINPSGASGTGFSRVDEYIFFVRLGNREPVKWSDDLLNVLGNRDGRVKNGLSWESFLRSGVGNTREARPNLCYPILVNPTTLSIEGVGQPLVGAAEDRPKEIDGFPAAWPVRSDGSLGMWRRDAAGLRSLVDKGYVYVSGEDAARGTWSLKYLLSGTIAQIEDGSLSVTRPHPSAPVQASDEWRTLRVGKTVWNRSQHNAGKHGSDLVRALLPKRRFPFPKALYAVEDALRFFVADKPDATVLDFFSGSGTTAHAVMRLNKQDGGHRQCISVTNNEVGADEQKALRKQGLRPGDPEWEQWGICDYITKPRVTAAITGKTPEGDPIKGDYKFTDEFPMAEGFEENAAFFTLTYEAPRDVRHNKAFERMAPMLWLRAGSRGRIITDLGTDGWDVAEAYGVLEHIDRLPEFVARVEDVETVETVFIVTDSDAAFQAACRDLPSRATAVRLYESYLHNFTINRRAGA
ncbi:site-specific DNA-methyltransferase [Acidipropionibacterium thoenii]|uniref:site-specific DNA-methyltransferase n=1 Tax=Acidipropionibacterium thoenii TaxID=1751 RepID=UPI00048A07B3|nr:DNA methyltransferase [Acidipropionibacterium thoenii]